MRHLFRGSTGTTLVWLFAATFLRGFQSPPGPLRLIRSGWRCLLRASSRSRTHLYGCGVVQSWLQQATQFRLSSEGSTLHLRRRRKRSLVYRRTTRCRFSLARVVAFRFSFTYQPQRCASEPDLILQHGHSGLTAGATRLSVSPSFFKPDNLPTKVAASTISYSKNHEKL